MSELDLVFRDPHGNPPTKLVLASSIEAYTGGVGSKAETVWFCYAHYGTGESWSGSDFLFRCNSETTARSIAQVLAEKLAVPVVDAK